jgi:epoxyqueuosine reductase QueG
LPAQETAQFVLESIKAFASTSFLNRLPAPEEGFIFDPPLVQFADGDDPVFLEYHEVVNPSHLTPRQALAQAYGANPDDMPKHLSVISWILPITSRTRQSNRQQTKGPSRRWAYTRWYGEKFNEALREHVVKLLTEKGYLAAAPVLQPYFKTFTSEKGHYSNWSERHIAYAAGLGTFSLSDGFITERGIAHRCGSVVTNLALPASPRTASNHYSNCLFYVNHKCLACIRRCPAGAITERGHDKIKCSEYIDSEIGYLKEEYGVEEIGCGLCQTKVPCEFKIPVRKSNT